MELFEFLSLGKSNEKYIPIEIKELSVPYLNIFLSAFCEGDGTIKKGIVWDGYKCKDQRIFFTSSKKLADDLGELILKTQNTPSYKFKEPIEVYDRKRNKSYKQNQGIWVITETRNKHMYRPNANEKPIHYSGKIYDVELEKNHTLFVRRDGKVLVSGNCRCNAHEYEEGSVWDKEEKRWIEREYQPRIERPKIKVTVAGQEYMV